mgnify:CR=1 FL=1
MQVAGTAVSLRPRAAFPKRHTSTLLLSALLAIRCKSSRDNPQSTQSECVTPRRFHHLKILCNIWHFLFRASHIRDSRKKFASLWEDAPANVMCSLPSGDHGRCSHVRCDIMLHMLLVTQETRVQFPAAEFIALVCC